MRNVLKNWKTSLFGLGSAITGVAMILTGKMQEGIGLVLTGITGLLSKDHDNYGY